MRYKRAKIRGGTYFFTVVTRLRKPFLCVPENRDLLRESFKQVMTFRPFRIEAFVLLPDHLHCIWTLPDGDRDFSTRWRLIKTHFTKNCDQQLRTQPDKSRERGKEQSVWQHRYWEHLIRDQNDFNRHVEYIHYNPVKHGYVGSPFDWEYSSFKKFVILGIYAETWGAKMEDRDDWGDIEE
ncbi:REP-associated tyrosine transposase [Desulfatibacillum aliphaticivorans]|uniref:REP-associated tyrosine transposase n=1 Tax=Desulfatibacillum aliphaticivorans TaxID=218208 RepID=UPI000419377B|nr:transposase [Desulfatibacillum aliphaticivorans]